MLVEIPGDWELVDTYFFPLPPEPWKRHNNEGRKPEAMRNYQNVIANLAREQVDRGECYGKLTGKLFVIFKFQNSKDNGDQTNNAKSIEDALNRIAWQDDRQNRQVLITETIDPNNPLMTVEIYKEMTCQNTTISDIPKWLPAHRKPS